MSQVVNVPILPAATVMCTRKNKKSQLEVLMLRRNRRLAFASGFWVFPGGKVELNDQTNGSFDEEAAKKAAIREAQEEAGLNLTDQELFHFMKWTTPMPSNKRFNTWFFVCHLDDYQIDVKIDDREIKEHRWLTPEEALSTIKHTDIRTLPPTFLTLVRIRECLDLNSIKNEFTRTSLQDVHPRTGMIDGLFQSMYPGDAGYETHDVLKPGPRHRITGNFSTGTYGFEYHGCDHVFPVSGGYSW